MTQKFPKPTIDIYFHMKNHYRKLRQVRSRIFDDNLKHFCVDNNISAYGGNIGRKINPSRPSSVEPFVALRRNETVSATSSTCSRSKSNKNNSNKKRSASVPPRPNTRRHPSDMPDATVSSARSVSSEKFLTNPQFHKSNEQNALDSNKKTKGESSKVVGDIKYTKNVANKDRIQIDRESETANLGNLSNSAPIFIDRATSSCLLPCCTEECKICENVPLTSRIVEEHEYLQFALRITEDIIRNNLYSNKEIKRVFDSHVEANRGRLAMDKMMIQIDNLHQVLSISETEVEIPNSELNHIGNFDIDNVSSEIISGQFDFAQNIADIQPAIPQTIVKSVPESVELLRDFYEDVSKTLKKSDFVKPTLDTNPPIPAPRTKVNIKVPSLDRLTEVTEDSVIATKKTDNHVDMVTSFETITDKSLETVFENKNVLNKPSLEQDSINSLDDNIDGLDFMVPSKDVDVTQKISNVSQNNVSSIMDQNISQDSLEVEKFSNSVVIDNAGAGDVQINDIEAIKKNLEYVVHINDDIPKENVIIPNPIYKVYIHSREGSDEFDLLKLNQKIKPALESKNTTLDSETKSLATKSANPSKQTKSWISSDSSTELHYNTVNEKYKLEKMKLERSGQNESLKKSGILINPSSENFADESSGYQGADVLSKMKDSFQDVHLHFSFSQNTRQQPKQEVKNLSGQNFVNINNEFESNLSADDIKNFISLSDNDMYYSLNQQKLIMKDQNSGNTKDVEKPTVQNNCCENTYCREIENCKTFNSKQKKKKKKSGNCSTACDCMKIVFAKETSEKDKSRNDQQGNKFKSTLPLHELYSINSKRTCDYYKNWQNQNKDVVTLFDASKKNVSKNIETDNFMVNDQLKLCDCGFTNKFTNKLPQSSVKIMNKVNGKTGKYVRFNFCTKSTCPEPNKNVEQNVRLLKTAVTEKTYVNTLNVNNKKTDAKSCDTCPCKNLLLDDEYALPDATGIPSVDSFYCVKHFFYPSRQTQTVVEDFKEDIVDAKKSKSHNDFYEIESETGEEGEEEEYIDDFDAVSSSYSSGGSYTRDIDYLTKSGYLETEDNVSIKSRTRSLSIRSPYSNSNIDSLSEDSSLRAQRSRFQHYLDLLDYVPVYAMTPSLEQINDLAREQTEKFRKPIIDEKHKILTNLLSTEELPILQETVVKIDQEPKTSESSFKGTSCCFRARNRNRKASVQTVASMKSEYKSSN